MTLTEFNNLPRPEAAIALEKCCGAARWVELMMKGFPFASEAELFEKAGETWFNECREQDRLEAFTHHPKIGDVESLGKKFAATKDWAGSEQSGVKRARPDTIIKLAEGNGAYEKKFGFIFIVCATGKTADEMLALLEQRLPNDYDTELKIAAAEQAKITRIRLEKLLA
jgi:2-oxo-4-hydroxy-4-carboxy-5-ureidoimidazoline decarboxylase